MKRRTEYVLASVASIPVLLLAYTALHEAGHAAVALAHGATIEEFVLGPGAHVAWTGGTWSDAGFALSAVAGAVLPWLVAVVVLCVYRERARRVSYHVLHLLVVVGVAGSTLPWLVIPALTLAGVTPPAGDDVTSALDAGLPGWALALAALVAGGGLVLLAVRRGVVRAWRGVVREVRAEAASQAPAATTPLVPAPSVPADDRLTGADAGR
jgi:hypothetical protein